MRVPKISIARIALATLLSVLWLGAANATIHGQKPSSAIADQSSEPKSQGFSVITSEETVSSEEVTVVRNPLWLFVSFAVLVGGSFWMILWRRSAKRP
jgi:hypothetical protein